MQVLAFLKTEASSTCSAGWGLSRNARGAEAVAAIYVLTPLPEALGPYSLLFPLPIPQSQKTEIHWR